MPSSLEDYDVICTIGSGSYGTCKKIRRKKDGRVLVWKELDYGTMTETEKQMLVSEVNLLRELKHRHIVRYYDRIIDRSNTTLYIIMEHCEQGDLGLLISTLKREGRHCEEEFVWRVCVQMVHALKDCHSRQKNGKVVLHRDLKPANVFLDAKKNVKLGDFGLARVLNHETSFARTFVGTPYYMSPEQMNHSDYNEKSDVWSLGCLVYELCALRPPFTASNQGELACRIRTGRFLRIPPSFTDELNNFIKDMLVVQEHMRPTIEFLTKHASISSRISLLEVSGSRVSSASSQAASQPGTEEISSSTNTKTLHQEPSSTSATQALRSREEAVTLKEKLLAQKEKELEAREKTLLLREKLVEEKTAKAEYLCKEYEAKKKTLDLVNNVDRLALGTDTYAPSILRSDTYREEDSPKKQVTFDMQAEVENMQAWYRLDLPSQPVSSARQQAQIEQAQRIFEMRQKLKRNKQRPPYTSALTHMR